MNKTIRIAILSVLLVGSAAVALSSGTKWVQRYKLQDERITFQMETGQLLEAQKYEDLDKLAESLRNGRERFSTGEWKLYWFYTGTDRGAAELDKRFFGRAREVLDDWKTVRPDSSAARVAWAMYVYDRAWDGTKIYTRPGGSSTLDETDLRPLVECWNDLQALRSKGKLDAEGYAVLLRYCCPLGKPRSEADALIREIAQEEPDYDPAYVAMGHYLLPHWYGAKGELEEFAGKVADDRATTAGNVVYARIARQLNVGYLVHHTKFSGVRIREGFLALQDAFPGSMENLNFACYYACNTGDRDAARTLFQRIGVRQDALTIACVWDEDIVFERWRRWAVNNGPYPGLHAIHYAAEAGDVEELRRLIKEGANIDAVTGEGFTALMMALSQNRFDAAMVLIESGANLTSATAEGFTPLAYGADKGNPDVVRAMIERKANPGRSGQRNGTALLSAAQAGSTEVVRLLLAMPGIKVNDTNENGWTAMHCAARQNHPDIVAMLAAAGGDLNAKDDWQRTPLQLAVNYGCIDAVAALLKAGADVNPRNFKNNTPTNIARRMGREEILQLLLKHGGVE